MFERNGQRLGSILHKRVEPKPADEPKPTPVEPQPSPAPEPEPVSELDELRARAEALGATVDKRWGAARLRQVIDEHEGDDGGHDHAYA